MEHVIARSSTSRRPSSSPRATVIGLNYAPEPTGIAVYTAGAARLLLGAGQLDRVITGYPHYPQWKISQGYGGWQRRERIDGVPVHRVRHYVPRRPRLVNRVLLEVTFGVRTILARWGRPDAVVLVSPGLFSTALALTRARLSGVRTIVWVQDLYSLGLAETGRGGSAARLVQAVERHVLRSADRVIVIHERFRAGVSTTLGVDPSRIDVVRNWSHVDLSAARPRDEVRAERGWSETDIVVLHAGNMGAKQGLENVVHASRLAAARESDVRFVLLGGGNQREALQAMGGNSRLEFIDSLPDGEFESVLMAADVLLVNEKRGVAEHAVPSKMTTYFASGIPTLAATDAHGITAEEVRSAGAGVVVEADESEQLLEAAERMGADPQSSRELGAHGRIFVERHLTPRAALAGLQASLARATGHDPTVPPEPPTS